MQFNATHYSAHFEVEMLWLRTLAIACFVFGAGFALAALARLVTVISGHPPTTGSDALLIAAQIIVAASLFKAALTWWKETTNAWELFKYKQTKARWRKQEPDWWWLERYPGPAIVGQETPRFTNPEGRIEHLISKTMVGPESYERFKKQLIERGYGPSRKDPLLDGAVERWREEYERLLIAEDDAALKMGEEARRRRQ